MAQIALNYYLLEGKGGNRSIAHLNNNNTTAVRWCVPAN
jgi:hypothetical protein